jgi:hypothetical protein
LGGIIGDLGKAHRCRWERLIFLLCIMGLREGS